jgi:DinB superfamily
LSNSDWQQTAEKGVASMRTPSMKVFWIWFLLTASTSFAQKYPEGIWQGYDGEWKHVSQQLIALADATPAEQFGWRPAVGVRSTSEVYMHIATSNFYLLSVTGPKMPPDLKEDAEKTVTSKAEVIGWLKRSLEAVKEAHRFGQHQRPVQPNDQDGHRSEV